MLDKTFTIVDVETTGASSKLGRIIEIGLLRIEHGEVVRTYKTFLNPGQPIPEFITNMTGIGDTDVASAPTFAEVADRLLGLFEGGVFVAHNALFDYSFVQAEFGRIGYGFNMPRLCTVQLSRTLFPEHRRHNLSAIIERFGFSCAARHRAFDDAEVLWQFLQLLDAQVPGPELHTQLARLVRLPASGLEDFETA
jgi:DNA polymerase-3 subunit epsilon